MVNSASAVDKLNIRLLYLIGRAEAFAIPGWILGMALVAVADRPVPRILS